MGGRASAGEGTVLKLPRRTWLLALGLIGLAVLVITRFADEREFARLLVRASPVWLVGALALQLVTYAVRASVWRTVLRSAGWRLRFGELLRLSFAKHFADQALPAAGLSGTLLVVRGLERRGVERPTVMAGFVVQTLGNSAALVLALSAALVLLATRIGDVPRAVYAGAAVFVAMSAAIVAVVLLLSLGRRVPLPGFVRRFRPVRALLDAMGEASSRTIRSPRLIAASTLLNAAIPVLDALTLWALLHSMGSTLDPAGVFVAFVVATLARNVSVVPGALGTFDAACVGALTLVGSRFSPAVAATLLFRGVSLWLPLLPGLWAARSEVSERRPVRRRRRARRPRPSRRPREAPLETPAR